MNSNREGINIGPDRGLDPNVAMIIRFEKFPSNVAIVDTYCTNPKCEYRNVTLTFFEIIAEKMGDKLFSITLNVDTWEMIEHEVYQKEIDCEGMIKEILRDCDEEVKLLIKKRFETGKITGGENLRENINYSILKTSECICYNEIFNSKDYCRFYFEYRAKKYLVLDQYCINPQCHCNDVVLMFLESTLCTDSYRLKFSLRLQLRTRKHTIEENFDSIKNQEIKCIYQAFLENLNDPGFKLLKARYRRMKNLNKIFSLTNFERNTMQNLTSNNLDSKKVGRNDPCPCGSGKKFKKCCGNAR